MTTETDRLKAAEKSNSQEWGNDFDRSTEEIKATAQADSTAQSCTRQNFNPLMAFALTMLFIGLLSSGGHFFGFWWIAFFFIWPAFGSCGGSRHHHGHRSQ